MNEAIGIQAQPIPDNKQFEDFTGRVFGRLTVEAYGGKNHTKTTMWICRCSCGTARLVRAQKLKEGLTKSCGCLAAEISASVNTKHGHASGTYHGKKLTRTYVSWVSMKTRCLNKNDHAFHNYGGRGITVCDRWMESFCNFLEDMGECPDGLQIERVDNELGYCKANCVWATRKTQCNNTRSNHRIKFQNLNLTIAEWSRKLGCNSCLIHGRLKLGWPIERILTTPSNRQSKH